MPGRGRFGRKSLGPGGQCYCPKCGYSETHITGQPCYQKKCPKCGHELELRSGVVLVCPMCGYVERLEDTKYQNYHS